MKNRFVVLCFLMLTCSTGFGQKNPELLRYRNVIKITPLKPFFQPNNAIELSYDRIHNERFTTTYSLSYLLPTLIYPNISSGFQPDQKGFRTSMQERLYFDKPNEKKFRKYVALELDYFNGSYNTEDKFDRSNSSTAPHSFYTDTFGVKKQFIALSGKVGVQRAFNRITVDVYAGLGLRIKHCSHQDRLHPEDKLASGNGVRTHYYYNSQPEGWSGGISVPLNIRFGYRF